MNKEIIKSSIIKVKNMKFLDLSFNKINRRYEIKKDSDEKQIKEFFNLKYVENKYDLNYESYVKGKNEFKVYKKTGEISKSKEFKEFVNKGLPSNVSKKIFKRDFEDITQTNTLFVSNKLRDVIGKPIKLKNNKYKVVTREKQNFVPSQFTAIFEISLKIKGRIYKKTVAGYLNMSYSSKNISDNDLIKLSLEKAISQFLREIGYNEGSKSIRNKLKVVFIEKFWISYINYNSLVNEKISRS